MMMMKSFVLATGWRTNIGESENLGPMGVDCC